MRTLCARQGVHRSYTLAVLALETTTGAVEEEEVGAVKRGRKSRAEH